MFNLAKAVDIALERIQDPGYWNSLIINRRKPVTYRAFTEIDGCRICLHKFEPCEREDSFAHPHPWPSEMLVLDGKYEMAVSTSPDLESRPTLDAITVKLQSGSQYSMLEKTTWHQVIPRSVCYSLMINGPRWEVRHKLAPSTSGKALNPMSSDQLKDFLAKFDSLLSKF